MGQGGAPLTIRQLVELHGAEPAGLPLVVHGYARADSSVHALRMDVAA